MPGLRPIQEPQVRNRSCSPRITPSASNTLPRSPIPSCCRITRLKHRLLGSTGIQVSEVGMGAWQLGNGAWGNLSSEECLQMLSFALDHGCSFFDTAPGYAGGHSEEVLGKAFAKKRDQVVLCTKFGHTPDGRSDFGVEQIRQAIEGSLQRLQTDYLDVLLLHNPPSELLEADAPHYSELEALKQEGKIRAYGASVDWSADLQKVAGTSSQAAEVLFNAFHQEPKLAFETASSGGVGLIVKVPLDSGWLGGRYDSESSFSGVRDRWSPEVISRRSALLNQLKAMIPTHVTIAQAALAFVLSRQEVSTVIPGAKSIEQLSANLSASDVTLSPEIIAGIEALWKAELAHDPLPW